MMTATEEATKLSDGSVRRLLFSCYGVNKRNRRCKLHGPRPIKCVTIGRNGNIEVVSSLTLKHWDGHIDCLPYVKDNTPVFKVTAHTDSVIDHRPVKKGETLERGSVIRITFTKNSYMLLVLEFIDPEKQPVPPRSEYLDGDKRAIWRHTEYLYPSSLSSDSEDNVVNKDMKEGEQEDSSEEEEEDDDDDDDDEEEEEEEEDEDDDNEEEDKDKDYETSMGEGSVVCKETYEDILPFSGDDNNRKMLCDDEDDDDQDDDDGETVVEQGAIACNEISDRILPLLEEESNNAKPLLIDLCANDGYDADDDDADADDDDDDGETLVEEGAFACNDISDRILPLSKEDINNAKPLFIDLCGDDAADDDEWGDRAKAASTEFVISICDSGSDDDKEEDEKSKRRRHSRATRSNSTANVPRWGDYPVDYPHTKKKKKIEK